MKLIVFCCIVAAFGISCREAKVTEKVPNRVEIGVGISAELVEEFSGEKAMLFLRELTAIGPRPPASEGYAKAVEFVRETLGDLGWETKNQTFTAATPLGPREFTNVLARYAPEGGTDWRNSVPYVLGSHLDTKLYTDFVFVGANDSGSSSAILMELARVLATEPEAAHQVELVFFDGEEAKLEFITPRDGLYGSKYYASELWDRTAQPQAALVLDLVGDPKVPFLLSPESPEYLRKIAERAIEMEDLKNRVEPADAVIIDDHMPLQTIGGLDSLLLIGDFRKMPYWHTKDDTLDKVSAETLGEAGRFALRFLNEMGQR